VSARSKSKAELSEKDLSRWKLIADFQKRLDCARQGSTLPPTQSDPRRLLSETDDLSLLLFRLFNPVVESMRGLCAASRLRRMQEDVCSHPVSSGKLLRGAIGGGTRVAALLLQNRTGRRPGKRAMEMIRFYLVDYADLDELCGALGIEKNQA